MIVWKILKSIKEKQIKNILNLYCLTLIVLIFFFLTYEFPIYYDYNQINFYKLNFFQSSNNMKNFNFKIASPYF